MSDKRLHATDRALIDAAQGNGEVVKVTPDLMAAIGESIRDRIADIDSRFPDLVASCPYEARLAVTAQVFRAIVEHGKSPGSFRCLIYDRLGFEPDAYVPLYEAGGMTITNEFDLSKEDTE